MVDSTIPDRSPMNCVTSSARGFLFGCAPLSLIPVGIVGGNFRIPGKKDHRRPLKGRPPVPIQK